MKTSYDTYEEWDADCKVIEEFDYMTPEIRAKYPESQLWTIIDTDDGAIVKSGVFGMSGVGFYATEIPVPEGQTCFVFVAYPKDDFRNTEWWLEEDGEEEK